jgi:hypothetical protein
MSSSDSGIPDAVAISEVDGEEWEQHEEEGGDEAEANEEKKLVPVYEFYKFGSIDDWDTSLQTKAYKEWSVEGKNDTMYWNAEQDKWTKLSVDLRNTTQHPFRLKS